MIKTLKPYLKDSRKSKVDQYIQLMNMSKIIDILPSRKQDYIYYYFQFFFEFFLLFHMPIILCLLY